ncbi:MAG: RHS repeat protein, partial [Alphaproteobacteria bacterium]|nr:RHS repeat protein [Alphaproteobacteria bacterium]
MTAYRADGQVLTFSQDANGNWTSDTDVDAKLTNLGTSWYLTDHNDTVETYQQTTSGSEALLQTIVSRDGYTRTLYYNGSNVLQRVADSYGRQLTFTYNQGLLSQVGTAGSLVLTYDYTSSGVTPGRNDQLASVTYNTTPATKQVYAYVNNYDLASITDENGNVFASWTYDSQNRATSSQHAGGADLTQIAYNDTDGSRTVTGPLGQQTVYTFQTLQGVPKVVKIERTASGTVPAGTETFTYDSNGYTASKTDWNGIETDYINDAHGDPTSITEAAGTPQTRTTT